MPWIEERERYEIAVNNNNDSTWTAWSHVKIFTAGKLEFVLLAKEGVEEDPSDRVRLKKIAGAM
jgi:hypothetical protein